MLDYRELLRVHDLDEAALEWLLDHAKALKFIGLIEHKIFVTDETRTQAFIRSHETIEDVLNKTRRIFKSIEQMENFCVLHDLRMPKKHRAAVSTTWFSPVDLYLARLHKEKK